MKKLLSLSLCLILLTFSVSGAVFAVDDNPLDYPNYNNVSGSNNASAPLEMTVTTSLDKSLYLPGDTATIGLIIKNIGKGDNGSNANLDLLFVMYDAQGNIIRNYPDPMTISNIDSFHIGNGETKTLAPYQFVIPSNIAVDKIILRYTVYDYGNFGGWKKTIVANGEITLNVKLQRNVAISTRIYEMITDSYVDDSTSLVANDEVGQVDISYGEVNFSQTDGESATYVIDDGVIVTLNAVAKTGYEFVGWYTEIVNGTVQTNPRTVEISSNTTAISPQAIFKKIMKKIDFSVAEASADMGTVIATTDAVAITSGSSHKLDTIVNLEASPAKGYRVKSWTVNSVKQESTSKQLQVKLDLDKNVVVEFEIIPTQPTTEVPQPTTGAPQPTTQAPQPTTVAPQPTTEAVVEIITEEEVALGDTNTFDFDSFIDESVVTETTTEAASGEVIVIDEATPLADALPQTGQLPVEIFYGIGGLITAAGVFLKKRK